MGFNPPLSKSEISENQRREERFDNPLKHDVILASGFIKIGDEFFSTKDLDSARAENPQPESHPFKPHHYCLQKDLAEIKAFYEKNPSHIPRK